MPESSSLPVERRSAERIATAIPVTLTRPDGEPGGGEVANVSASGMLVRSDTELAIWSRLTAVLPGVGARDVRVVRRDKDCFGCLFQEPLDDEELEAVLTSEEALAGRERLRAAAEAPPPQRRGLFRLVKR